MPSFKTAFGAFLKTEDLQNRPVRVVIESVGLEDVKGESGVERKLVAHFVGKDKGLILNLTNCESLEGLTGTDDYEGWVGAMVTLYPTTTKFGNKTVPCLRIRAPQAPATQPTSARRIAPPPPVSVPAPAERQPGEDDELLDSDIPW